ncbi:hypothetical protein HJFPF1_00140 [Paramyrothecium foliicola]|nr:hypothetical protein HJFPF1_00140 [Paramyrothecium foliicola]
MTPARRETALVLATLLLRYDLYAGQGGPMMELYETKGSRDVNADSDYIILILAKESQGVRIKLRFEAP